MSLRSDVPLALDAPTQSCFDVDAWPATTPAPRAWIEFDVDDLTAATHELQVSGQHVLASDREEPWGQRVTRLLSPEGLLAGLTVTPALRERS